MTFFGKDIKKFWMSATLLMVFLLVPGLTAQAQENVLRIKPARCIALHQGQVCYQTLKIEWQADAAETYCLFQQDIKAPVLCWENLASGRGNYEFESDSTRKFILVRKRDNKALAEASVEVAWVYDASSRRESHWRIF